MEEPEFYNYAVEDMRSAEFPALKDMTYVDHAGSTLYARRQIHAFQQDLCDNVYGNPHSASPSSKLTTDTVDHIRFRILKLFNTTPEDYTVIFTSGCTGALKLLAESFSFSKPPPQHAPTKPLQPTAEERPAGTTASSAQHLETKRDNDTGSRHADAQSGGQTVKERPETERASDTGSRDSGVHLGSISVEEHQETKATDTGIRDTGSQIGGQSTDIKRTSERGSRDTDAQSGGGEWVEKQPTATRIRDGGDGEKTAKTTPTIGFVADPVGTTQTDASHKRGVFCYLQDNHTSVQGMRGVAAGRCCAVLCVTEQEVLQGLTEDSVVSGRLEDVDVDGNCLFAFPGQSNFSGRKYPLRWVEEARDGRLGFQQRLKGRWFVVLDAASLVSTSALDLTAVRPDFLTLSFYKILGFPTGLGALLVRNSSSWVLERGYYGGGTVAASTARQLFCVLKTNLSDRFEDGTLPYLDIIAVRHGFNALEQLTGGMDRVSSHTFLIAQYFAHNLSRLRHGNGAALAEIYSHDGFRDRRTQGAIVNFSLKTADGQCIGFAQVDRLAQLHDIHLRTGCFCNIGACQTFLAISSNTIRDNLDAGHVCGDDRDLINGRPTGSVRISFGYMSSIADASRCLHFIADCFLDVPAAHKLLFAAPDWFKAPLGCSNSATLSADSFGKRLHGPPGREGWRSVVDSTGGNSAPRGEKGSEREDEDESIAEVEGREEERGGEIQCSEKRRKLTDIFLYPVKSCGAFRVTQWEIGERGLLYDRTWMVVSDSGVALGQKREPRLCLLRPLVHLQSCTLELTFPGVTSHSVPLDVADVDTVNDVSVCTSKICSDRVRTVDCGDGVAGWLCLTLERPGLRLLRQLDVDSRHSKRKDLSDVTRSTGEMPQSSTLSLANESQFLLISRQSVRSLRKKLAEREEESQTYTKDRTTTSDSIDEDDLVARFRANLVIDGGLPFDEDSWTALRCGHVRFSSQGQCSRCGMICLNQNTGEKTREPLRTLAAWRGGKVYFGVYLRTHNVRSVQPRPLLTVGSEVTVL